MASTDFHYLSYLILFVLVIYFIILSIFLVIRRYEVKSRIKDRPPIFHSNGYDDSSFTFDWTTRVEEIADSIYGRNARYVLCGFRIIAAVYFFAQGIVVAGSESSQTFNYFDGWNMILLFSYFTTATASSVALIRFSPRHEARDVVSSLPEWSYPLRFCAVAAHLMFEVACTNALFILFGEIVNINSVGTLQDVNIVAVCFLTFDLLLNNIKVRFDQYPAAAAWLMSYLLVIWPSVFTGTMESWPYPLLDTSNAACFSNYFLLFLANFLCAAVWYGVYRTKQTMILYFLFGKNGQHRDYESREIFELADMRTHSRPSSLNSQRGIPGTASVDFYNLQENQQENHPQGNEENRPIATTFEENVKSLPLPLRMQTGPTYPNPLAKPASMRSSTSTVPIHTKGSNYGQQLMQNIYDADTLREINQTRRNLPNRPPSFNDTDADIIAYGGFETVEP